MAVEISATLVKDLRERTGVGFMECKKALLESGGDLEGAVKVLRARGIAKAEKRSGRAAAEGLVGMKISADRRRAALVELNSETDFVARNEQFVQLLAQFVDCIFEMKDLPAGNRDGEIAGEAVLDRPFPANPGHTMRETLVERIAKIGENLVFRRLAQFETADGFIAGYIHPPGKIGVMVEMAAGAAANNEEVRTVAKDIAMHIAAAVPRYLDRDHVCPKHLESEKDIFANKARNEGKPEKILPKIVEGMVQKFYKDVCLVDQPFVRNPDISVAQLLADTSKKVGGKVEVRRFIRFQVGESASESEG